jgi:hypothetical protein
MNAFFFYEYCHHHHHHHHVWGTGEVYTSFGAEPKWKDPLGRPRRKWENNIKINLQIVRWEGMD